MKYLVMERRTGYAVLLDEAGCFWKAADLRYAVGQTVCDPVLLRDAPRGGLQLARRAGAALALAACLLLFAGFGYYRTYLRAYSFIYLSINPQVQMDLNRRGTVVRLTGTNEDGQALLQGYSGRGKDTVTVADELIDRAIEMGFLSEGGQVSFSIDTPDEALFQEYGTELRTQVNTHLEGRITVTIQITDFKQEPDAGSSAGAAPPASSAPPAPVTPQATPAPPPADGGSDYGDSGYGAAAPPAGSDYAAAAPQQGGGDSGYETQPVGGSDFEAPAGGSDFGDAGDADDDDADDDDD